MNHNGSLLEDFDMWDAIKTYLMGIWSVIYLGIQPCIPDNIGELGEFCNVGVAVLTMVLICVRIYNDIWRKWRIRK